MQVADPVFGGQATVYEAGDEHRRSVVLVHGLGTNGARDFANDIPWLARSFHVVAVDLPGFGSSEQHNAAYTPRNYVAFLKRTVAKTVQRPFVLVGHSMGALIALRYAGVHPDDVERLIVADAPGILHRHSFAAKLASGGTAAMLPGVPLPLDRIEAFANKWLGVAERAATLDVGAILAGADWRQRLFDARPERIAGFAVAHEDPREWLAGIRAPTLIVWGSDDRIAPLRTARLLAGRIAGSRVIVLDRSGHTPMLEVPKAFRAAVEAFARDGRWPEAARAAPPLPRSAASERSAHCTGEDRVVYEGDYRRIVLERCRGVRVRNSTVRELRLVDSTVTIENSAIGDGGLSVRAGAVEMTGGRIEAPVAITAADSHLDFAGVEIVASETVMQASAPSSVVFTLSRLASPVGRREEHGYFSVTPAQPLP